VLLLRWRVCETAKDYRLYTNVQAAHAAPQRYARFVDKRGRQTELLCGKAPFRAACRLTGFGPARRIIRIRMNGGNAAAKL